MARHLRPITSSIVCTLLLARTASAAISDPASIRAAVTGIPVGASVEVRLKDKQKLRGARGLLSDSGFTLVDTRNRERQIAFVDVDSVKQVKNKTHTGRNVLIGVGIGVALVAILIVSLAHQGGYL